MGLIAAKTQYAPASPSRENTELLQEKTRSLPSSPSRAPSSTSSSPKPTQKKEEKEKDCSSRGNILYG